MADQSRHTTICGAPVPRSGAEAPAPTPPLPEPLSFADLKIGTQYWSRFHTFTSQGVMSFAREWDPQPYHTDEDAAQSSVFGRLSASGIHSFAVSHRIFDDMWLFRRIGLAGIGMQNFRWRRPVYPGDTVRVRGTIAALEPRRDGRAALTMKIDMFNQDDVIVLCYELDILVRTDR